MIDDPSALLRMRVGLLLVAVGYATAFTAGPVLPAVRSQGRTAASGLSSLRLAGEGGGGGSGGGSSVGVSRRGLLIAGLAVALSAPLGASAADKDYNDCGKGWSPGRQWLTGKSCQEKGKDNQFKDNKGTKKDPKFLKNLQGCRANCQAPSGSSAESSTTECLKKCRDQVCVTYEQCTYQIGPKEDYGGFIF